MMRIDHSGLAIGGIKALDRLRLPRIPGIDDAIIPPRELLQWNAPQHAAKPAEIKDNGIGAASGASAAQGVGRIDDQRPVDAKTLAQLSDDVYNDKANPPAGWTKVGADELRYLGVDPRLLETEKGFRARVYAEDEGATRRYVVAFRGSQTRDDWKANFQQAVGIKTDHYSRALKIGDAFAHNRQINVTMTGHSLGGGMASASALACGREAATFNASGLSQQTIDAAARIRSDAGVNGTREIKAYYVRGEILSAIQDGGDRVIGALLGGIPGAYVVDAPPAYGTRVGLDAVRPEGKHWWNNNAADKHGMDWALASMHAQG